MHSPSTISFIGEEGRERQLVNRLDQNLNIPIFEQIRAQISVMIAVGYLLPRCQLPTVRNLASQTNFAPGTIARCYRELERDGLIIGQGRRGTFVVDKPPHSELLAERRSLFEKATQRFVYELKQLGITLEEASLVIEKSLKDLE